MKTNLAYQNSIEEWNLPIWDYLVKEITTVFSLSLQESEKLANSKTAKIIASLPFVANCIEPERTAIAHLVLYMAEIKGFQQYCAHVSSDDKMLLRRLDFISTFEGGDQKIIEHGMYMLALIMLEGYKKSSKKDAKMNIYNPLVSGTWNYQKEKNKIITKLSETEVPKLDNLYYNDPKMIWS